MKISKKSVCAAPSKVAVSIKAEAAADNGYKFTDNPPFFCAERQAWVCELEKPDDLYLAELILVWWLKYESITVIATNEDGPEPDFVTEAKATLNKYHVTEHKQ